MTKASKTAVSHSAEDELPSSEILMPLGKSHPFDIYVGGKVITLATLLRRSVAIRHQRMFGVSMVESRAMLRIGASGPLSLDGLADHIAIGKSQTSRVVTALVERKLVQRERDPNHPRGVAITLSPEGRIIERALIEAAAVRNQELTGGLDPDLLKEMAALLDVMAERARDLLQHDQLWAGRTDDDSDEDVLA